MVEHSTADREVTGSNPVAPFFFIVFFFFSFKYRVFSHDVTSAILVSQKNETAAMLVFQTSPVGVELFSYVNNFFCSNKFAWILAT